ncbi:MAG: M28 family peptidase [Candidatus Obscuribacterales bacterium]
MTASTTADAILEHIKSLASDRFEGRSPGSDGERITIDYLRDCCRDIGLAPAGEDGYFQRVPVIGIKSKPVMTFKTGSSILAPAFPEQFVAMSRSRQDAVEIENAPVVFAGYGIEAPEYGWNDYKDLDVRGKVVIVLIGQPGRPDREDSTKLDESFFRGRALTYYGRWTYKYEKASEKGAAAILIVHESGPAGYGYDVVKASWSGENFDLGRAQKRVQAEGWLSLESAEKLFAMSARSYQELKKSAGQPDFEPVDLGTTADLSVANTTREFDSHNVLAMIEGEDPDLKRECIVYSAHWDHFGKKEKDGKVEIYSGALDNGSGVAMVLEIGRRFVEKKPRRSILFLFTTLEESGLIGSQYYIQHPVFPLERTVAVINLDVMNLWGATREIISIAHGHSTLDESLSARAAEQNRAVIPDVEPEKGYFYRSDHLPFLQSGVPALFFLNPGSSYIGKDPDYATLKKADYISNDYHKPSDKVKDDWDMAGAVEDVELLFRVGQDLVNDSGRPSFKPASEFFKEYQKTN